MNIKVQSGVGKTVRFEDGMRKGESIVEFPGIKVSSSDISEAGGLVWLFRVISLAA